MSKLIIKFNDGDVEEIDDVLSVEWDKGHALWVERESDYVDVPKDKCVTARGRWCYDVASFAVEM